MKHVNVSAKTFCEIFEAGGFFPPEPLTKRETTQAIKDALRFARIAFTSVTHSKTGFVKVRIVDRTKGEEALSVVAKTLETATCHTFDGRVHIMDADGFGLA